MIIILKFRYLVAFIFIAIFVLTILISINPVKNFILLDDESSDRIFIKLEAPRGTNLDKTYNFTKNIEDIISNEIDKKYILSIKTLCGHHTIEGIKHKGNHENWALISINLVPITERKKNADQIITLLRKKINTNSIKYFEKIMILKDIKGPPTGDPVDIKIIGNNKKDTNKVKKDIQTLLNKINGVIDIDDDQKEGKTEIIIDFDYNQMAKLGINVAMVAQTVRAAYEGVIASSIETTEKKLDFRVKIDDSFQKDKIFLENLLIPNKLGRLIKLKEIAKFNQRKSKSSINHYNGDRVITITANILQGKTTPTKVINHIKEKYNVLQKTYPEVELKYGGEAKETQDTLKDLKFAFIIAVILIYFVLILLFKSATQPLIVMITIPFGIIGAMLALILHGIPLSFLAIIGIIGLSGVVVNDSVIMVDFINKVFKNNKDISKIKILIANGAKKRLRPVILTTLTTIAGLLPTAYGLGGDAGMLVPIVLSIAYGILFATTLTLIFIPSLYMIRIDIINLFNKFKNAFIIK